MSLLVAITMDMAELSQKANMVMVGSIRFQIMQTQEKINTSPS